VPLRQRPRKPAWAGSVIAACLVVGHARVPHAAAAESESTKPAPVAVTGRSFADPPVSVRVAPELLIAPKLQGIPFEAYGFSAAVGPRFEGRGFYFIPALALDLLWGETENGLGFRSTALSFECDLAARGDLDWLHFAGGFGASRNQVSRATTPSGALSETVPNAHLLLSADVLRVSRWWAFWVGGGVRFVGEISAPVVMLGGRI
jgi:hypothetical protein